VSEIVIFLRFFLYICPWDRELFYDKTMTELSNTALIRAIHAHTPPDSTPASVLMDVLNIGREAAYRRMRGNS